MVLELVGGKGKLVYKPLPSDDPMQRKPDITLAKTKLGWEPKVQLREGLQKTIAYFKSVNMDEFGTNAELLSRSY